MLKRIFNLAIREDLLEKNPCWKVTRLSENNARNRVLSCEELERLVTELPMHAADLVIIGYHTGMRFGKIVGLTWDRVNLKEGYFNLTAKNTKTSEPRHVYFNDPVREILDRVSKIRSIEHSFVFTYRGNPSGVLRLLWPRL